MTRKEFSDDELTAYLDGEAGEALSAQIADAVKHDALLEGRIKALEMPLEAVKGSFDALLRAAPTMEPLPSETQTGVSFVKLGAAMAASLVIGALASFWALSGQKQADWRDYAAAYHALYVNGTLAGVANSPAETEAALAHLGTVLAHDLSAALSDDVLEYKRGQVLGFQGQPMIQLAYLSPLGDPVALCLIRSEGTDAGIEMKELEGLAAAQWQRDGVAYLLIGGTDAGLIEDAAARFSDTL